MLFTQIGEKCPELLCSVPTLVDAGLQEWRLTGDGDAGVDKDLWIPYQE